MFSTAQTPQAARLPRPPQAQGGAPAAEAENEERRAPAQAEQAGAAGDAALLMAHWAEAGGPAPLLTPEQQAAAEAYNRGVIRNVVRFDRATHGSYAKRNGELDAQGVARWQKRHEIEPADGRATDETADIAEDPNARRRPQAQQGDPPGPYDTTGHTIQPPVRGTTIAQIRQALAGRQQGGHLGTYQLRGVASGAEDEIFLGHALAALADRRRFGSEVDVVTDIGWPPLSGGTTPKGRITVRLDGRGNAEAELVGRGAISTPQRFATKEAAIQALKMTFFFREVRENGAQWRPAELNKVFDALGRLSGAEKTALFGVDLVRADQLIDEHGNRLAGRFDWNVREDQGHARTSRALNLADAAFANDDISFIGDAQRAAPASYATILHEVGHAVEAAEMIDATGARMEARLQFNARNNEMNAAVRAFNPAQRQAMAHLRQQQASQPFVQAFNDATRAISALGLNEQPLQNLQLAQAAQAAVAQRDARRAVLATVPLSAQAQADIAEAVRRQDAWYQAAISRAIARASVAGADQEMDRATVPGGQRSRRLQRFVDFVNQNHIAPLTAYARRNWPAHPDEFYAEAFTLWKNDPAFLQRAAPALRGWFDRGEHLQ